VTFFQTAEGIPVALGNVFQTSEGAIVHTGEFKVDQSAKGSYRPDIAKMAKLGEDGVLMLLSDSTEAERPGYTTSEIVVADHLQSEFRKAEGRILVSLYSSNFIRIQQVFDIARATGKKVAVVGKSLESSYEVGVRLGYLDAGEDTVISLKELDDHRDEEIVIIVTGNQGETVEALDKMVRKQHKDVRIKETDTVLITFTPSPGMEVPM